jgi:hypothetical protein
LGCGTALDFGILNTLAEFHQQVENKWLIFKL